MRTPLSTSIEKDVLTASRRRCCLCVFLSLRDDVRKGQIAHLNRDSSDSRFDNLVYLCLEHHDEYDSKPSQSKGYSEHEVREYRDQLYSRYRQLEIATPSVGQEPRATEPTPGDDESHYERLKNRFVGELDFTLRPWRYPLWMVANEPELFAYKADNGADGVCLIERIDLPDERIVIACIEIAGNPGRSITNSVENLCFQVCERFDIPAERLVWLEHYDYHEPAEWDIVTFARHPPDALFANPKWTELTPELWRELRLRPRKRLRSRRGHYESKLTKLFRWETQALL